MPAFLPPKQPPATGTLLTNETRYATEEEAHAAAEKGFLAIGHGSGVVCDDSGRPIYTVRIIETPTR